MHAVPLWKLGISWGCYTRERGILNRCRLLWIAMSALWDGLVWLPVGIGRRGKGFWRWNGRPCWGITAASERLSVQKAENSELTLTVVARTNLHSLQCPVFGLVRVTNTAQSGCWLSQLCGILYKEEWILLLHWR